MPCQRTFVYQLINPTINAYLKGRVFLLGVGWKHYKVVGPTKGDPNHAQQRDQRKYREEERQPIPHSTGMPARVISIVSC